MKKTLLFTLIFCFATTLGTAQYVDSLKNQLRQTTNEAEKIALFTEIADDIVLSDPDQADLYADSAEVLLKSNNIPFESLMVLFIRGSAEKRRQKFEEAKEYFNQIINHPNPNEELLGKAYHKMCVIHRQENKLEEAVQYVLKAKEIFQKKPEVLLRYIASCDVELGILYKKMDQYDKALNFYNSAFDAFEILGNKDGMATCILNSANALVKLNRQTEALELFDEALILAEDLENNEGLLAYIYGNQGNLYSSLGEDEKAYGYSLKAYELRKDKARPYEIVNSLIGLGVNLRGMNQRQEAIKKLNEALEIAESHDGMLDSKYEIYQSLYTIHKELGNHKLATEAADQFHIYTDSLNRTELNKKVLDLNEKYEADQKEKKIALLNADKELTATKLAASRRQTYGLLTGLLIISGLLFGLFRLFRKTRSQNTIITKALSEKELLLKEIHHRVKNNLQFISSLLRLQSDHVTDSTALSALQQGHDRVRSMALIHQNLYQDDNLTGVDVKEYFSKLIKGLFSSMNIHNDRIKLEMDIQDLNLDVDTIVPIGLIVNELITNCLKYAFPNDRNGEVKIKAYEDNATLHISISDNGVGISEDQLSSLGDSFGYKMIRAFVVQQDGEMTINNNLGTSVNILMKRYDKV